MLAREFPGSNAVSEGAVWVCGCMGVWGHEALFDLGSDPAEQRNVAEANPEVVRHLHEQYDQMKAEFDAKR